MQGGKKSTELNAMWPNVLFQLPWTSSTQSENRNLRRQLGLQMSQAQFNRISSLPQMHRIKIRAPKPCKDFSITLQRAKTENSVRDQQIHSPPHLKFYEKFVVQERKVFKIQKSDISENFETETLDVPRLCVDYSVEHGRFHRMTTNS